MNNHDKGLFISLNLTENRYSLYLEESSNNYLYCTPSFDGNLIKTVAVYIYMVILQYTREYV